MKRLGLVLVLLLCLSAVSWVQRSLSAMIQARDCLRFALETDTPDRVVSDRCRENLDGDVALQSAVARAIDFAHPTCTNQGDGFVRAETSAGSKRHREW